jgi:hypothetical protein
VLADEPDPWFISRSLDTLAAIALAGGRPTATTAPNGRAPPPGSSVRPPGCGPAAGPT